MRLIGILILSLVSFLTITVDSVSATEPGPVIPNFWDARVRLDKPTETQRTIRFLASDDFPPFAFRDPAGRLTGFDIDLARAICEELEAICTLRVEPFDDLLRSLASGEGDAVIAGLEPGAGDTGKAEASGDGTPGAKASVIYSAPYLKLPARFVVRKHDATDAPLLPETMAGKWISVADGTTHAAFLQKFFPQSRIATYPDEEKARDALRRGEVDAHFGDGMALSYWLQGTSSVNCCAFAPGPWLEPGYFDHGLSIAVRAKNENLRAAINYALQQVNDDGRFGELYLRYFPISFY
ncbi:amino acid ABC transporter substrate-binding protein (PAAT family) [Breoghania corrubedonensis]|uniref:Amino acid ABC transporter substrate-binding protein (PAAT family) n=1 Tax=Breoghania corrubedonensis TaxID=665038 RepID=A0A2T5VEF0_9HYPH|nr:transporter substrate-binding domain-containing protein [Breoghania corrubedonensis]PTW62138.1 amino acid ABC transporter substrate-binding protein (PAAT family) [Breoghania corrubedonensis]